MDPQTSQDALLPLSQRRRSVFMEVGLVDEDKFRQERQKEDTPPPLLDPAPSPTQKRPGQKVRFRSKADILGDVQETVEEGVGSDWEDLSSDCESDSDETLADMKLSTDPQLNPYSRLYRLGIISLVLAILLPVLQNSPILGSSNPAPLGVNGGVIPLEATDFARNTALERRDDSPTVVCKRWGQTSAIVNGTLYLYGGHVTTQAQQTEDTWTNDFLSIDLTKSWQISTPSISGFPQPSGPPAVSNAWLWSSHDSLYLYGGEFSDNPVATPVPFALWEYSIGSNNWIEHSDPQSSAGTNSEGDGQSIQRAAEGAGFSVSTLGRGWYFGGHQDYLTTAGWSVDISRIYLKSLVEFTFPGFANNDVTSLGDGKTADTDGVWRNVTEGGSQASDGFTERADGLLLYVPGFGSEGILIGLTGGTNATFTQMNIIDVYDIANSTWYKQTTTGQMPKYRVNACAVVAAAADGSSYNVYMFGGQDLQPYLNQTQYDDMWILSIPSFTWISVDQSTQSVPYARAGHTCNIWDGQMIVVGGYVSQDLSCDSPGIAVFNLSSLEWGTQFTALTGDEALQTYDGKNDANPLAQQANQRGFNSSSGLEGSYGYEVPAAVQSVIGGGPTGGATLTAPVQTPTGGPLATGKPITYTVTGPGGATITETSLPSASNSQGHSGPNIGAIVAGVIAGVFAIIAAYMAFCAWIYRKQVRLYKNHAAVAARAANTEKEKNATAAGIFTNGSSSGKNSSDRRPVEGLFASSTNHSGTGSSNVPPGTSEGPAGIAGDRLRRDSDGSGSSSDDLLEGQEPSFWGSRGVLLNPRRSLRVINRD